MTNDLTPGKEGYLWLIDKPLGWTSFDVIAKLRGITRIKKIGHAGTLDPLATGLLIVCAGKMTKQIDQIQAQEKEYEARIQFGATTPSYDAELPPENFQSTADLTLEKVTEAMKNFTGEISQRPPVYSAVKVGGKRAYESARKGLEVEMPARKVNVYEFSILSWEEGTLLHARLRCSKGTYIRSIAHDLGQAVTVGAYLSGLRRTKIGGYSVENATSMEDFARNWGKGEITS
jgi:tRNA pseudouridine55 synthase